MRGEMEPFGVNLQADVVTMRNGISSIYGLAKQGGKQKEVGQLWGILKQIEAECLETMQQEETARAFAGPQIIGGFVEGAAQSEVGKDIVWEGD